MSRSLAENALFLPRLGNRLAHGVSLVHRSYRAAPARWIGLMGFGIAVCVLMAYLGVLAEEGAGYSYTEFRAEGHNSGMMTGVSAFLLGAAAMALFAVAALFRHRLSTRRMALPRALAALGLFVLGADDLLMLHETLAYALARSGFPRPFGLPYEVYVLGLYAAGCLLLLGRLASGLRRYWRALFPMTLALALFATAALIDLLVPVASLPPLQQEVMGPADRIAKTLGPLMTFAFAHTLLFEVATDPDRD
jgi:hypothetical protein